MKNAFFKKILMAVLVLLFALSVFVFPAGVFAAEETAISSVEVTQIMGKGVDIDSGKLFFMNTFVAEKPTSIQVVLTEMTDIRSASLEVFYEGNKLTKVSPKEKGKAQLLTFTPDKSAVNAWKAGRYKFVATVNGAVKTTEAIFNASRKFSVLVISAAVRHGGNVYEAPELKADTVTIRTQAIPVSESKLKAKYRNARINFGTGDGGYDIGEGGGSMNLLSDIESYRIKSAQDYDAVVAVVNAPLDEAGHSGGSSTKGYTNCGHAVVLTLHGNPAKEEIESTLLHELGHILGSGDEYPGGMFSVNVNGVPYGITGSQNGKTVTGEREYLNHIDDNQYSGILIREVQNPYNPKAGAAMLDRSSYMGSGHKHWPTNMVWEEAYKHLISNYQNVLPRVYTDGSIIAERPSDDELSSAGRDELIAEFRKMLNEVRVQKGLAPYNDDNILAAGQKHFHTLALDMLKQRDFSKQVSMEPVLNSIRAETNSWIGRFATTTGLYEYDGLQFWRGFFSESPCGNSWISDDYMLIDFVKCEGVVYFMYTTLGNVQPNKEEESKMEPQPKNPPIPEVNPVTDDIIDPDKFANGDYEKPQTGGDDAPSVTSSAPPVGNTTPPRTQASTGTATTKRPGESPTTPAFADLTQEQRLEILCYDGFSFGYISQMGTDEDYPYQLDYIYDFYAWYANDRYGLNITGNDAKNAINKKVEEDFEDYDGIGQPAEAETPRFDLICVYYELYPTRELRDTMFVSMLYPQWRYGKTPKRAKGDTESIHADYGKPESDIDINDPDGEW